MQKVNKNEIKEEFRIQLTEVIQNQFQPLCIGLYSPPRSMCVHCRHELISFTL